MEELPGDSRILAQFVSEEGVSVGSHFDLPLSITKESLLVLCNTVLQNASALALLSSISSL